MRDFLLYFEFSSVQNWMIFIVKDLIFSAIVAATVIWIKDVIVIQTRVSTIVTFLLDKNHATRQQLKGRHLADRVLDIYNNGESMRLISRDQVYENQFWSSIWNESVIDRMLEKRGLVEMFEENGRQHVQLADDKITKKVVHRLLKKVNEGKL